MLWKRKHKSRVKKITEILKLQKVRKICLKGKRRSCPPTEHEDVQGKVKVKVQVNFAVEQATKAQSGSRGIALLFI